MKFSSFILLVLVSACKFNKSYESKEIKEYKQAHENTFSKNAGQTYFMLGDFGSLNLASLFNTNILPIKVYGTALIVVEEKKSGVKLSQKDVPALFQKFGFIRPTKIGNWQTDRSPEPSIESNLGLVNTTISKDVSGVSLSVEVANLTCAACHSSVTYNSQGLPTKVAWLGAGNTSLNVDGLLSQIYEGLKIGMQNPAGFVKKIQEVYPGIAASEVRALNMILIPSIKKALKSYKKMDRVLPFPNGGPGHTNGVGAFKRDAKILKDPYSYHADENGVIGIPNIMDRGFRSSLTIDGAYGVPGEQRFRNVLAEEAANPGHLNHLAELAVFFTYSAMGNDIRNIESHIPEAHKVFNQFISHLRPHKFPGNIDRSKASMGERIFRQSCTGCHGVYTDGIDDVKLVSFPNKLIPQSSMGTDPRRWMNVTKSIADFSNKTVFGKYVNAGHEMGGYVAPILSGIWFKAPYLHNGSVPTLWHLMNPSERPKKFEMGGHAIDLEKVGIKGSANSAGSYAYPPGYQGWSQSQFIDTTQPGMTHVGHDKPFEKLSEEDKWSLIEYLKLL